MLTHTHSSLMDTGVDELVRKILALEKIKIITTHTIKISIPSPFLIAPRQERGGSNEDSTVKTAKSAKFYISICHFLSRSPSCDNKNIGYGSREHQQAIYRARHHHCFGVNQGGSDKNC